VPHGLACAVLLPTALRVNREVRQAELARLAHLLFRESPTKSPQKAVDVLIHEIEALCRRVGVPARLADVGVRPEQIPTIARESLESSSMKGNPRQLTLEELTRILD
jgi:alcohol dehydrogenase class IV